MYLCIVPKIAAGVNQKRILQIVGFPFIFYIRLHILDYVRVLKGGIFMAECNDPYADLEDLLFDEDAGGPSQR